MSANETVWQWEEDAAAATAVVSGEVDYSVSPHFRHSLKAFIAATEGAVTLDLGELRYLDSSGLAVLIEARRLLHDRGRALRISRVTPQVEKILQLTQVADLFGL